MWTIEQNEQANKDKEIGVAVGAVVAGASSFQYWWLRNQDLPEQINCLNQVVESANKLIALLQPSDK